MVRNILRYSIKLGIDTIVSTSTVLLASYAKCGCIEMAGSILVRKTSTIGKSSHGTP